MDDQRPTPRRAAAWTVLAGLWFGAPLLLWMATWAVVAPRMVGAGPFGLNVAVEWAALVLAGGGAWWTVVERRGATDVDSATVAGAVAGVAGPWTFGVTMAVADVLLHAFDSVRPGVLSGSSPLGPVGYAAMAVETGLVGWAAIGVPAAVAGAVVGRLLGTFRRQKPPSTATHPGRAAAAVTRRLPDVALPPAALGAAAFGVAGALGMLGLFRTVPYSPIPSLAMLSAGAAAAATGGFTVRWLHSSGATGLRAGAVGAAAGAAAVPFGRWLLVLAGQAVRPGVVGEVEEALAVPAPFLLQVGAVGGGLLAVALAGVDGEPDSAPGGARDRHPDDAAPSGTRRTHGE